MRVVQDAIDKDNADVSMAGWLPKLSKVKLQLQTVVAKRSTDGIEVLFISMKGYDEQVQAQEIDIVLEPRTPSAPPVETLTEDLRSRLTVAIANARRSLSQSFPGEGKAPTLDTKEVDIQVGFSITVGGSGAASWDLSPVGLSGAIDRSNRTTQTITLVFAGK